MIGVNATMLPASVGQRRQYHPEKMQSSGSMATAELLPILMMKISDRFVK